MLVHDVGVALRISVAATGFALLCFGAIKGQFTGVNKIKAAAQTLLVGGSQRVRLIGSPICLGRSVADVHGLIAINPSCSSRA